MTEAKKCSVADNTELLGELKKRFVGKGVQITHEGDQGIQGPPYEGICKDIYPTAGNGFDIEFQPGLYCVGFHLDAITSEMITYDMLKHCGVPGKRIIKVLETP